MVKELEKLAVSKKGKENKSKAALKFIARYEKINTSGGYADDSILGIAKNKNAIVLTNDKELKNRLKKESLKVIFLRKKQKLSID